MNTQLGMLHEAVAADHAFHAAGAPDDTFQRLIALSALHRAQAGLPPRKGQHLASVGAMVGGNAQFRSFVHDVQTAASR